MMAVPSSATTTGGASDVILDPCLRKLQCNRIVIKHIIRKKLR